MDGEELRNGCCGWRCDGQPRPAHEPQVMQASRDVGVVGDAGSGPGPAGQ